MEYIIAYNTEFKVRLSTSPLTGQVQAVLSVANLKLLPEYLERLGSDPLRGIGGTKEEAIADALEGVELALKYCVASRDRKTRRTRDRQEIEHKKAKDRVRQRLRCR